MSGGFFRGTSADQDTRFSNKQAKLLKSQKFAPELDHLVDMTKVKMDVVRPWIANRVTELLGFEDEVLINFIYGLLDGKDVNGKQVQISLTGFMEKNTGKFMKELWMLLLSAQKNASGVPQQFLDAKEEETRQKKAEADRIANEIQKRREKEDKEHEQEKMKKMDGGADFSKANSTALEPVSKHLLRRASSAGPEDEKEMEERNGLRGKRVLKSPHLGDRSSSSPRGTRSRSISKSFSNSGSFSDERHKSRSISGSPQPRERSISSDKVYRSPRRRSVTPRRRHSPRGSLSPSRQRSSYFRRRFRSRSPRRSPSPVWRRLRSPLRRRSPSPVRRRSISPVQRRSPSPLRRNLRSPMRRRSPSPVRRRLPSPVRRRSQSPMRHRSPSPLRRISPSPLRRRSPSPVRRRSPSPVRRRSPSPARRRRRRSPSTPRRRSPSPVRRRPLISSRRRSPTPSRRRSPPYEWSSPSPVRRRSPSPARRKSPMYQRRSPVRSSRERIRTHEKLSPVRYPPSKEKVEHLVDTRKGPDSVVRRPPSSLRSPQRDLKGRNDLRDRVPSLLPSPEKSAILSGSPLGTRRSASEDRRSSSPYESPVRQTRERTTRDSRRTPPQKPREQKPRQDSPETSGEGGETYYAREDRDHEPKSLLKRSMHSSNVGKQKDTTMNAYHKEEYSPERLGGGRVTETRSHPGDMELRKKEQEIKSERTSGREVDPEVHDRQKSPTTNKQSTFSERQHVSYSREGNKANEKNRSYSNNIKDNDRHRKSDTVSKSVKKVDQNNRSGSFDSCSEDSDKYRANVKENRKHKRSDRHEMASDRDDSPTEERKEVKRRRKEEKRLRKEERRRRREERRRKKEERRAEKLKVRLMDTATPPSDFEKNQNDAHVSDGEPVARKDSHLSDTEETESEQKKLEIELRKKALESLQAKKGIRH